MTNREEDKRMARKALEFFDTGKMPWEPHVVGGKRMDPLQQKILSYDDETGAVTLMVKYPKGYKHPLLTYHTVTEELYVLKGRLTMQGNEYSQGYYAYRPPGMVHGEMEILDDDTVLLIMLSGPLDYHEVEAR
jgi:quercetin dioxygenase-like cupin family protein